MQRNGFTSDSVALLRDRSERDRTSALIELIAWLLFIFGLLL